MYLIQFNIIRFSPQMCPAWHPPTPPPRQLTLPSFLLYSNKKEVKVNCMIVFYVKLISLFNKYIGMTTFNIFLFLKW